MNIPKETEKQSKSVNRKEKKKKKRQKLPKIQFKR